MLTLQKTKREQKKMSTTTAPKIEVATTAKSETETKTALELLEEDDEFEV
jgi:hypothetical protein